jgi:hypothetical protein
MLLLARAAMALAGPVLERQDTRQLPGCARGLIAITAHLEVAGLDDFAQSMGLLGTATSCLERLLVSWVWRKQ